MHVRFICLACGKERAASARSSGRQSYCGLADCQRARKAAWKRERIAVDADYRANQQRCVEQWRRDHPGYWSRYREMNPAQAERNRQLQGVRNRRRRSGSAVAMDAGASADPLIAKVDAFEAKALKLPDSGEYWLIPVIAKVDASRVKIITIPDDCPELQKRTRSPPVSSVS